eukprot:11170003-Lingulodinium_polyedra.AAC.1
MLRVLGPDGAARTAAVLREPLALTNGKGALPVFAATIDFVDTLREMGHKGIAVHHYCFDRALCSALGRLLQQHHLSMANSEEASSSSNTNQGTLQYLAEWIVVNGCCNHDVHNALHWGLFQYFPNPEVVKDVYIAIDSLRKGYTQLIEFMAP